MATTPRKEGFLKKQGHVRKNWKLRFFILEDWTLSYYESRQSSQVSKRALGKLFLQGATVEAIDTPMKGVTNIFQVKTKFGNKKFLNIAATSSEDMKEWIDTIKANIDSSVGAGNVKFSKPLLDFGLNNQTADLNTPIYDEFDIISLSTKKMKFRFEPLLTKTYDLTFEPAAGSISKFGRVTVKAKMVVNNPEIINAKAPLRTGEAETTYLSFRCRGAGGVFGCDPTTLPCEWDNGYKVPSILVQMKRSLMKNNAIAQEGIFRLAGDAYDIKRTKETMNKSTFDEDSEVNVVASLIKIWFRELPVPILNVISKEDLMNCGEKQASFDAYLTLPEPQKSLLDWLLDLLLEFSANSAVNKMSLQNLAIVVAPNLYDPPDGNPMEGLVLSQKCVQFFHNLMVHRSENPGVILASTAGSASGGGSGSGVGGKARPQPRYSTPTKGGSLIQQSHSAPSSPVTPSAHSFSASSPLSSKLSAHSHSSSNLSSISSRGAPSPSPLSSSSDKQSASAAAADLRKLQRPPPPSARPRTQPPQVRSQLSDSNITVPSTATTTESASAPKPLTPSVVKARQKSVFYNNTTTSTSSSPLPPRTATTTAATSYSTTTTTPSYSKSTTTSTSSAKTPSYQYQQQAAEEQYQEESYTYQNTNGDYGGVEDYYNNDQGGGEGHYDNNDGYYNNEGGDYDESGYYAGDGGGGDGEYYEEEYYE